VAVYTSPNRGIYEHSHRAGDIGKFRVPSLRNVAVTAPYMHDGSVATLEEVIEHYAVGGKVDHPNMSRILRRLTMTDADQRDRIEFLKSLTDEELLQDLHWSNPWPVGNRQNTAKLRNPFGGLVLGESLTWVEGVPVFQSWRAQSSSRWSKE